MIILAVYVAMLKGRKDRFSAEVVEACSYEKTVFHFALWCALLAIFIERGIPKGMPRTGLSHKKRG